ncbi:ARM repeat-containing protein [Trichoderma citrinoviride]|uniref:ARM repeat-containing protein n=1 Tax=Trichoderma citrinoviride TaxID=58853 RepID=A0A2T4BNE4_9HYPO|nr:ARM repeat-containing protein [Trichoderma citrinoviride]PTB70779.1 ARM repeat-containing protein [Trichoderma citrinoviride]
MADTKLTDDQVNNLATVLRNDNTHFDVKVQYVNAIKSGIKQHNIPETCIPQLFDGLRLASSSQHVALATAGFTALNHLFTRMSRQEPKHLAKEAARTLPLVIEKLGDSKDKPRALALQSLNTLYAVAPADVERSIRNTAMVGKNPRAKEASMQWLLEHGLPFRSFVPMLMDLLEDADGMVRDTAKSTVIELFKNAPAAAKSDLKRQLKNYKIRPAIEQAIVKALAPAGPRSETPSDAAPTASRPALSAPSSFAASERPTTPMADIPAEPVEPQYVNTNRELDDIIREMTPYFEGKESEHNWMKREQSIVTLRRLVAGNAPAEFTDTFIVGLKGLLDGIIKAINSLRTSLSKEGCSLVQEMAVAFGPAMDPLVELLMQTFMKLSANTKKISSQMANTAIDVIISKVTYTPRIMQHIWGAVQDKNVQPRTYAAGWLITILKKEAHHKNHIEHTGGVDLIEKCIKKALGDANPTVREKMRACYWRYWTIWPARADALMADLDTTAQKLLLKDPNNPSSGKKVEAPAAARPGAGFSRSTTATSSKPSLRDAMLAQKKAALATRNLPTRPGSAMSSFTTASPHTSNPQLSTTASKPLARHRTDTNTISVNAGGMSVAPMRPAKRRPEVARPATAGPYSVRDQPSPEPGKATSATSSTSSRQGGATTPKRPSSRAHHASHASESGMISPTFVRPTQIPSPRASPARLRHSQTTVHTMSPTRATDDLTLVVPTLSSIQSAAPRLESPRQPAYMPASPPAVLPSGNSQSPRLKVYEDPFTEDQPMPTPSLPTAPVLEERTINEDAANIRRSLSDESGLPEKNGQNARLLDSGISKIRSKTLEVHGFRKLQSLIRDPKTVFTDQRFEALLVGLFQYLEDPLSDLPADKAQDVKAQILTTIKLLLKKERKNFQPHVSRGLESLLQTRGSYDTRAHVVSGLELLADELVTLSDGSETAVVLTKRLQLCSDTTVEGCRTLSMGLHVLKEMLDKRPEYVPTHKELLRLTGLAGRCLESTDSGVRMDAVKLCVALHARVGEAAFWEGMAEIRDDPKSLITYYIVKKQREDGMFS